MNLSRSSFNRLFLQRHSVLLRSRRASRTSSLYHLGLLINFCDRVFSGQCLSRTSLIEINCIHEELKEVSNWFKANKLSVTANKTNYMILGTPHMVSNIDELDENVILDSTALERVRHTKFLGVLIDDCLTWKNHIDCVSKTISRNIGVMNKLKHFVPTRVLHTLYPSFALFELRYTYMG